MAFQGHDDSQARVYRVHSLFDDAPHYQTRTSVFLMPLYFPPGLKEGDWVRIESTQNQNRFAYGILRDMSRQTSLMLQAQEQEKTQNDGNEHTLYVSKIVLNRLSNDERVTIQRTNVPDLPMLKSAVFSVQAPSSPPITQEFFDNCVTSIKTHFTYPRPVMLGQSFRICFSSAAPKFNQPQHITLLLLEDRTSTHPEMGLLHVYSTAIRIVSYYIKPGGTRAWFRFSSPTKNETKNEPRHHSWFDTGMQNLHERYHVLSQYNSDQLQLLNRTVRENLHTYRSCYQCCKLPSPETKTCSVCQTIAYCSPDCFATSLCISQKEGKEKEKEKQNTMDDYFYVTNTSRSPRQHTPKDCRDRVARDLQLRAVIPVSYQVPSDPIHQTRYIATDLIRNSWLLRYDIPSFISPLIEMFTNDPLTSQLMGVVYDYSPAFWYDAAVERSRQCRRSISDVRKWYSTSCKTPASVLAYARFEGSFRPVEQWNPEKLPMSKVKTLLTQHTLLSDDEKWNVYLITLTYRHMVTFLSSLNKSFRLTHSSDLDQCLTGFAWITKPASELFMCGMCLKPYNHRACPTCMWSITSTSHACVDCLPHLPAMCAHFTLLTEWFVKWLSYSHGSNAVPEHVLQQFERRANEFPSINERELRHMYLTWLFERASIICTKVYEYNPVAVIIEYMNPDDSVHIDSDAMLDELMQHSSKSKKSEKAEKAEKADKPPNSKRKKCTCTNPHCSAKTRTFLQKKT
jgi:hypothetical protein